MSLLRREEYYNRGFRRKEVPFSIEELSATIQNITYIHFAYLFGSAINAVIPKFGDIDIAVFINDNKKSDWDAVSYIINTIEQYLQYQAECDLTIINTAGLYLRYEILKGKCLFVKPQYDDIYSNVFVKTCYEMEEAISLRKKYERYFQ
jgi:predicted nucleotidyltransferase